MNRYQVLDMKTILEGYREFELPATVQKSYYGKARVIECSNGKTYLQSYETIVARIEGKRLYRMWSGYSVTTMKHINDFARFYGFETMNKSTWERMEVTA